MISCYLRYVIDPYKTDAFETYVRMWIPLVEKLITAVHNNSDRDGEVPKP